MDNKNGCNRSQLTEYERLLKAFGEKTQREASSILGVMQRQLSDCKRRGGKLSPLLLQCAQQAGISRDWLIYGRLPMLSQGEASCRNKRYCKEQCPAADLAAQLLDIVQHCRYLCRGCPQSEDDAPTRSRL